MKYLIVAGALALAGCMTPPQEAVLRDPITHKLTICRSQHVNFEDGHTERCVAMLEAAGFTLLGAMQQ